MQELSYASPVPGAHTLGPLQSTATLCSGTRHQQSLRHLIPPSHWLHFLTFKENHSLFQTTCKMYKTLPNISSLCCDSPYFIWGEPPHQGMPPLARIRKPYLFCLYNRQKTVLSLCPMSKQHKLRDSLDLVLCFNHNCTQPEQRHFTSFLSLAGQFHEILVAWVVTAEKCIMTFSLNFLYKIKLYRHFSITWNKKEKKVSSPEKNIPLVEESQPYRH